MKLNTLIATGAYAIFLLIATTVQASEKRPAHYDGAAISSWSQAQEHLIKSNQELAEILAQETLTHKDGAKVHELTYTLENALEYMEDFIENVAEQLEEVHVASERAELDKIKSTGEVYLKNAKVLENK